MPATHSGASLNNLMGRSGCGMHKFIIATGALGTAIALGACASSADKINAQYISPLQYQSYSCSQLGEEAQRISGRVAQVSGTQDQKATNDALITTAAIIVFWPAAFFVSGNDQTSAELGRLKGEFEAVEKAAIQKNCGLQFRQQQAPPKREPRESRESRS